MSDLERPGFGIEGKCEFPVYDKLVMKGGLASRHESLNSLFQVALYLPSWEVYLALVLPLVNDTFDQHGPGCKERVYQLQGRLSHKKTHPAGTLP